MRDHYNMACDIIDEVREVAADSNVSFDQALQAIRIAALIELKKEIEVLADTVDAD